jgi:hypothetical protein
MLRSILNPLSLSELSVQPSVICWQAVAVAVRFEGAVGGVGVGVGLGGGGGIGVAVAVGVGVGVGLGCGVGVGVDVGVGVVVGVGVGVAVVPPIWTIFATEGTPSEFRIKSM